MPSTPLRLLSLPVLRASARSSSPSRILYIMYLPLSPSFFLSFFYISSHFLPIFSLFSLSNR